MRLGGVVAALVLVVGCGGGSHARARAEPAPRAAHAKRSAPPPPPPARAAKAAAPTAETLARVALSPRSTDLLAGRLKMKLPARARPIPDEPGQDPSFPRDARYRIEVGSAHVILRARELVARQGEDLEHDVRAEVARWPHPPEDLNVGFLTRVGDITVLRMLPAAPIDEGIRDGFEELALGAALFVAHPDGSMLSIELHVNEEAGHDTAGLRALATRMGGTVTAGRRLPVARGTKIFTVYRRGPELRIDLPSETVAVERDDRDGEEYSLRPLRRMGGQEGLITIRIGGAPPEPAAPGRRGRGGARGRLLERDVSWQHHADETGRTLQTSFTTSDYPVSVSLAAPDEETLATLKTTVESMRLSHACNQPGECPAGERCESEFCRTR